MSFRQPLLCPGTGFRCRFLLHCTFLTMREAPDLNSRVSRTYLLRASSAFETFFNHWTYRHLTQYVAGSRYQTQYAFHLLDHGISNKTILRSKEHSRSESEPVSQLPPAADRMAPDIS